MHLTDRSQPRKRAADFVVSGCGSVYLVHPLTDDARNHLLRVAGEEAQFLGNAVAVEHRYVVDFVAALQKDGFTVANVIPRDPPPEELRSVRAMSGLTVKALAARAGLSSRHLAAMEAGTRPISMAVYNQVFNAVDDVIWEMVDPGPLWS